MKKLILTAIAVFTLTFVNAQDGGFAKGDIFLSGSFGYNSTSTGDIKDNSFEFTPRAGFFVSDNIAVGARLGFTTSKQETPITEDLKTNTFNAGAFGRYYFTPSNKFSIFGELGLEYASSKTEQGPGELKINGFGVNVGPGVSYFLSDHFALEAFWGALGYATAKPDVDNAESTNAFTFGLDLDDINLGLVYKF
ncbi:porin family protein [Aquimarina litoralis]|uniref:porin family protein n=1 Tax=Aquimarina litoralis TaxID=584605 RepID=UPI001C582140|nr:porin family protein [Aquimarina litoralis]MBW1298383.1 outer membrane beta-barrel protein [Aquimarina litoralis]